MARAPEDNSYDPLPTKNISKAVKDSFPHGFLRTRPSEILEISRGRATPYDTLIAFRSRSRSTVLDRMTFALSKKSHSRF